MPDYKVTVRRSTAGWTIVALMIIIGVVAAGFGTSAQVSPGSASTTATLKVVPTMRYVTVSPAKTTFARCKYGRRPFHSKLAALGFPNGACWIGSAWATPITIKNGSRANVLVQGYNAVPSNGGSQWSLCNSGSHPAVACTGPSGRPGKDQYLVENFSRAGRRRVGLTDSFACDVEFDPSGGCLASTGQTQHEGILLIGPYTSDNYSTLWKITITWIAVPPEHQFAGRARVKGMSHQGH